MEKILILGSSGMLGHLVYFRLKSEQNFVVQDISFKKKLDENTIICDVTDFTKLSGIIKEVSPDYIINCIGILIKGSHENPKNSILINSYFPHWLVSEAEAIGAKIIHISTDCVFSGSKGKYSESDFRDADDVYGRGKALGEIISQNHLTIRTSIIGPELKTNGEGLFHWFMMQNGTVNGYVSAYWGGVTTVELSKTIIKAINQNILGLINVTNGSSISKYDLLSSINQTFKRNIQINAFEGKNIDKSLISIRSDFDSSIPSYISMIQEMKEWMENHHYLYSHYNLF